MPRLTGDPMDKRQIKAEEELAVAVREEKYEEAARLQAVLKQVGVPPSSQVVVTHH